MKRIAALALGLALVCGMVGTEPAYVAVSATNVSQTITFAKASATVLLCNDGAGIAYYRLFNEIETSAAATNANASLPVSACISHSKGPTEAAYWKWASIISASTSTVRVYSD